MVEPPDEYSFRRKFIGGLPLSIVKMVLEARGITAEHSSMDEILNKVKRMEGAQKALSLMMRNNPQSGGTISKGSSSSNHSDASKSSSTNNSDHQQYKFVRKGNLLYRRPLDRDRSTSAQGGKDQGTRPQRQGSQNSGATAGATNPSTAQKSSNAAFHKGITCYNCGNEGHLASECWHPKKDKGKAPQVRLYAVDVREGEVDTSRDEGVGEDHPTIDFNEEKAGDDAQGAQEHIEIEAEHLNAYSTIDEEEDDDELIRFLGAMHPIEEFEEPDEEHVVQCCSMQVEHDEGIDPSDTSAVLNPAPLEVEGNPQQRPVGDDSTAAQGVHSHWTWRVHYGAIHWGDCAVCTEYICHLDEAVWDDNPSVVIALREIEQHAREEYDRGWNDCDQAQMQCNWAWMCNMHKGHMTSPQPLVDVGEATPEQTRPMNVRVQASEPVDEIARADSPPAMITDGEEHDDLLESELHRIVAGMGLCSLAIEFPVPTPASSVGDMHPQALTETSILHYKDNTVVIVRGNGRETVISSGAWNGDRAPARVNQRMAAMTTEPMAQSFRYALNTNDSQGTILRPVVPAGARACVTVEALVHGCHALAMIDTGSMGNFLSPAFTTVTCVATFPLEQQLTLQLGCVGSRLKITHGVHTQLSIGAFSAHVYFDVANIDQYNCILGIPFLWQNTAVVDFGQQKLHIGRGEIPMLQDTKAMPARPSHMHVLGNPPWHN